MNDDTCTIDEVTALLGVSRSRVRALLASGKLEPRKNGRHIHVTRRSVYEHLAASDNPPGVNSLLSYLRFLRSLSAPPRRAALGSWELALQTYARELFGHTAGAPYREKFHTLALTMLATAELKNWRRLDEQRSELYLLWTEYDFVAAPLEPQTKELPKSVQTALFEPETLPSPSEAND